MKDIGNLLRKCIYFTLFILSVTNSVRQYDFLLIVLEYFCTSLLTHIVILVFWNIFFFHTHLNRNLQSWYTGLHIFVLNCCYWFVTEYDSNTNQLTSDQHFSCTFTPLTNEGCDEYSCIYLFVSLQRYSTKSSCMFI